MISSHQGKIVFFHMNQLGDLMFSLPLLSAARKQWRGDKLYSVVRPELSDILAATGFVDEVIERPRNILHKFGMLSRLKQEKFNQAILFSESPESCLAAFSAGIPERAGFQSASLNFLLTKTAARVGVPSLANNNTLAKSLGINVIPADYSGLVSVPDDVLSKIERWLTQLSIAPSKLIVVSPGASRRRKEKCWDRGKWAALLDILGKHDFTPVLTGAPSESEELELLASMTSTNTLIFPSDNGLLALAALLRKSSLFVGIDSGAMHLAAALSKPVVALFGPTDPAQVGPMPLEKHHVIKKDHMKDIRPQEVWREIEKTL